MTLTKVCLHCRFYDKKEYQCDKHHISVALQAACKDWQMTLRVLGYYIQPTYVNYDEYFLSEEEINKKFERAWLC